MVPLLLKSEREFGNYRLEHGYWSTVDNAEHSLQIASEMWK